MKNLELLLNDFSHEKFSNYKIRVLKIDSESIKFIYIKNGKLENELLLNIGVDKIVRSFFKNEIPNEGEIENAINYIEDILMSLKELRNNNEELYCVDLLAWKILGDKMEFSRQEIEEIFTKYAIQSLGQISSHSTIKMNHKKYAVILIIREIMHHLNFEKLNLFKI